MRISQVLPKKLQRHLVRRLAEFDDASIAGMEACLAQTESDLHGAFRVLHDAYVGKGLASAHPSRLRVTAHLLLPQTHVFVARRAGSVIGTIALTLDSGLGLPLEPIARRAVAEARSAGGRVAEVGSLCVEPQLRGRGVTYLLNKVMWRTAVERLGVTDFFLAAHPRALPLYEALAFEKVGGEQRYPGLVNAPGVVMWQKAEWGIKAGQTAPSRKRRSVCCVRAAAIAPVEKEIWLPTAEQVEAATRTKVAMAPTLAQARFDVVEKLGREDRRVLKKEVPTLRPMLPSLLDGSALQPAEARG